MVVGRSMLQQMHGPSQADGVTSQLASESLITIEHARRHLAPNLLAEHVEFHFGLGGECQGMKGSFVHISLWPLNFQQGADMASEPDHQFIRHFGLKGIGNL